MDIQKFFISFNSLDQQKAHWIAWTLREEGHEVAVHDWEIPAGGNAPLWMNEKLAWADRLIAVVSPDYLSAKYSTIERAAALWDDPDGKKGAVVPVIVRPTSSLPPLMKGLSRIDLTGVSEEVARDRLLAGIKQPRPPLTKPVFNVVAPEKHEQGPSSKPAFSSVEETNVDTEAFEISPYDDTHSDMPGSIGESKKPGKKEGRLNWKSPLLRKILIGLGAVVLFTFIWYQGGVQEKLKNKIINVSRSYLGHIAAQDFAALAEMAGTPFFFGEHVLDSRDAVQNYFMRMFELSQNEPQKEDELEFGPAMYRGTLFSRRAIEAAELPDFNFVKAGDIVTKLRIYSSDEQKKPTGPPPILDIGKNAARADIRFRAFKIENIDVIHLYFSTDENVPRLRGVLIR